MESRLQVHFVPQSVTVKEEIDIPEDFFEMDDSIILEGRLKQCIEQEDYILAGKIRDVIEELNKRKK
jgi:protein-arginine kinase activator protein McsA